MEKKIYFPAPIEGKDVDQTKAQVENVAEPIQGSPQPQSPEDSATSDEETTAAVSGEQVQASTEATDGDTAVPTEGYEATTDTTESNDAVQGDENTSAEQDSQAQATTGAGPENESSTAPEQKQDQTDAASKSSKSKKSAKKAKTDDFTLNYPDEKKKELERVTKVVEDEIRRVINDPRFHAIPFDGGNNAIINVKEATMDGITSYTPEVNRKHGRDEKSTGDSLMVHGPQHPFIIITKLMADAAGISFTRFANDPHPENPIDDDYAIIDFDGNGRKNYLLTKDPKDWPNVYGIFPTKNSAGLYDLRKDIEIINTQVTVWKTCDFVIKRILEEGIKAHEGWKEINKLQQNGYNYQAACEAMTLGTDRITKSEINSGDAEEIFGHYESAKTVHEALVAKFGEGDDNTLKTKAFPAEVSKLWQKLQKKRGDEVATEHFVKFIEAIPGSKVNEILVAKSKEVKGARISKDEHRIMILKQEYKEFMKKNPLN